METLTQEGPALLMLVFALGLRHGFDADHLATVDGLTRWNLGRRAALAPWCGALFSLGHGAVVVAVALGVALLAQQWAPPQALLAAGAWFSVAVLALLGLLNLHAVFAAPRDAVVRPQGLRAGRLGALLRSSRPLGIAALGAAFALSFDTLSLAALFGAAAGRAGGAPQALLLGLLFTAGMLAADGANGWWIARLLCRADETARVASRVLGLAVGVLSLMVAAYGAARQELPALDHWSEDRGWQLSLGLLAALALSFAAALRLARAGGAVRPSR